MAESGVPKLILHPDRVLRQRAHEVGSVTGAVRDLAAHMLRIMREEEGIGLAAPQVGHLIRLFVTEARPEEGERERVFIDPIVEILDGELMPREEGCLSLPEIRGLIRRPSHCIIRAKGLDGAEFRVEGCGLMARCWQHEMDHLEGVLIIDRMSPIDRLANRKRIKLLEADAT